MLDLVHSTDGLRFGPLLLRPGERRWVLDDWPRWEDLGVDPGSSSLSSGPILRAGNMRVWLWSEERQDGSEVVHAVFLNDQLMPAGRMSFARYPEDDPPVPAVIGGGLVMAGRFWVSPDGLREADPGLVRLLRTALAIPGSIALAAPPESGGSIRIALPDGRIFDEKGIPVRFSNVDRVLESIRHGGMVFRTLTWSGRRLCGFSRKRSLFDDDEDGGDEFPKDESCGTDTAAPVSVEMLRLPEDASRVAILHSDDGGWLLVIDSRDMEDRILMFPSSPDGGGVKTVRLSHEYGIDVGARFRSVGDRMALWISEWEKRTPKRKMYFHWRFYLFDPDPGSPDEVRIDMMESFHTTGHIDDIGGWVVLPGKMETVAVLLRKPDRIGMTALRQASGKGIETSFVRDLIRNIGGSETLPAEWQRISDEDPGDEEWRFWRHGNVLVVVGRDANYRRHRRHPIVMTIGAPRGFPSILRYQTVQIPNYRFSSDFRPLRENNLMILSGQAGKDKYPIRITVSPDGELSVNL